MYHLVPSQSQVSPFVKVRTDKLLVSVQDCAIARRVMGQSWRLHSGKLESAAG
jgi:hypothetical protein